MSILHHAPQLTTSEAVRLAGDLYGLEARAEPLPSERDQNFLLETASGRFVLKLANANETREILDAQNAALEHVAARVAFCPRVIPTRKGEAIARDEQGHLVRLVTWLPGRPLATMAHHPSELLDHLGRCLGQLNSALADFDHPALHRDFYWDLAGAVERSRDLLRLVEDVEWRATIARELERIDERLRRWATSLRRSIVHNDANDYNVLVERGRDGRVRVSGIVDFGDMVHSYRVADAAVGIAYAVLGKQDPLAAAVQVLSAYHSVSPLTEKEAGALFDLVKLRLCLSAAVAASQQAARPADDYLGISQQAIRATLPVLIRIPPELAEAALRRSCGFGPLSSGVDATRSSSGIAASRSRHIGGNVRLAYRKPLHIVRGWMQHLYDDTGRRFLDGYNNVPHVGHCHPAVADAAERQMRTLNTNTRYLHENLSIFAGRLVATLPEPLRVCYFVSSGSEANELAIRLARAHTHARDVVVLDAAYHGITTTLTALSPYKFNGPGGEGRAPWVHVARLPDLYRGSIREDDPDAGRKYADDVGEAIARARAGGGRIAAFLAESAPSVAGQIMLPDGYLQHAYEAVRAAGGVCIADEVQTAYGRVGSHFYAFEAQHVVPDIVVLGKPIGNGFPLGAVVTTPEIAASFDNGLEFFSTFGGSTLSCAVGLAVLDVCQREQLQMHARRVGACLIEGLRALARRHSAVGEVRGSGLFVGVDLVANRETRAPAAPLADYVVNRMCEAGVLIGTDGPHHNVLKIRPPMPFNEADAEELVGALDAVLGEI